MNLSKMLELTIAGREDITKSIELEEMIKQGIAEEEAKKTGNINIFKSIKKYIDKTIKDQPHRIQIHGTKVISDKMVFTNCYSAFRLNNIVEGLPEVEEGIPNIEFILEGTKKDNDIKVETPNITDIKTQLKTAKAIKKANKVKSLTEIKEGLIKIHNSYLNIELFLDVIEILGTDAEIYANNKNPFSPVYFESKNGDAVLLPIRNPESAA